MTARIITLAAAATLLAACDGPTMPPRALSDVYDFRLQTSPPRVLRWPSGTAVRVFVATDPGTKGTLLHTAFDAGATEWNMHALYGEYSIVAAESLRSADVLLRWSDEPNPVDMTDCEPVLALAVTTFCLDDNDATRLRVFPLLPPDDGAPSSIRIVVTVLGAEAALPESVLRLVTHELGHVLGIGRHSLESQDLMYGGVLSRATLSRRDASTVHVLYHTEAYITP